MSEDEFEFNEEDDEDDYEEGVSRERKELGEKLYRASVDGVTAEVARLLDLNAPVNHRGVGAKSPLMIAAIQGHLDIISLLVSRGAKLEARNRIEYRKTALMYASHWGTPSTIKLLVEKGANLDAQCSDGKTPLMFACKMNRLDIVEVMVDTLGARINFKNPDGGFDALLYAALHAHMKVILFLISRGGDPRVTDSHGRTALTHFGNFASGSSLPTKREAKNAQRYILKKWKAGCHPDARWLRRRDFLLALVGSKLRPMARDLAAQKQIQATMDLTTPLDPEDRSTPEANWTYLLKAVFGHDGIVRCIIKFA